MNDNSPILVNLSPTMYDASVPVFKRMLANLSRILTTAHAHAADQGLDPQALLHARLYPDMFPLVRQVQIACDHAKGATARLAGLQPPPFPDDEKTFEDLLDRIDRTRAYIAIIPRDAISDAATRRVALTLRGAETEFTGKDYLFNFALPNFFFHVTTAYGILRHKGLDIGKRDYIG
jgi:hypothetical protein